MMQIKNLLKFLSFRSFEKFHSAKCRVHSFVAEPQLKSISEIPGPLKLPLIGNAYLLPLYWAKPKPGLNEWKKSFDKYGSIYSEKMGETEIVHISGIEDVEKIFRSEGKYPRRISVEPWKRWRDERGLPRGVLTEEGASWKRLRKHFDKPMMTHKYLTTYIDGFREIADDFLDNIERTASSNGGLVANMEVELFHWSIENIASVLYEARLGALSRQRSDETSRFVRAVQDVFSSTSRIFYTPHVFNKIFMRKWQQLHDRSWEIVFDFTAKLIDKKMKEIECRINKGEEVKGYLSYLISTDLSHEEIHGSASEIMFGAVDTTSVTMQWILYELSNHPNVQDELRLEILSKPEIRNIEDVSNFPFLRAFLKEILRMYPVALVASRILNEDTEISGYLLPKDTTVMANMCLIARDEKYFKDATSFKPHRWLRSAETGSLHTFAWLPFGFGQRSCIGKRLAELEIYTLLSKLLNKFSVEKVESDPIFPIIEGLLGLSRPVNVKFTKRT